MPGYPTDHAGLEILPFDECLRLLASVPVGRVGFFAEGEIVVLPVNHVVDGQDVVFRTAYGSKLSAAGGLDLAAFEADHYNEQTRSGWSVLVTGRAEMVDVEAEIQRLSRAWPAPVGHCHPASVLDPDTAHLSERKADTRDRVVSPRRHRLACRMAGMFSTSWRAPGDAPTACRSGRPTGTYVPALAAGQAAC